MKFFGGLHSDNHPVDQPENTYRDARGAILGEKRGAVANEGGTASTSLFPFGYLPIGRVALPDSRIVVFLASPGGGSEIGIIGPDGAYATLVNDARLGFDPDHPIQATVRLRLETSLSQQFADTVDLERLEDPLALAEDVAVSISAPSASP